MSRKHRCGALRWVTEGETLTLRGVADAQVRALMLTSVW
jgi:hypothetical protein